MILQNYLIEHFRTAKPNHLAGFIALTIAGISIVMGLLLALLGPLLTFILLMAGIGTLWILARVEHAVWGVIAISFLLPYATLPFKVVITPTFLDIALLALYVLYLVQWMTGERRKLITTPIHPLLYFFMLLSIFSFVAGLRYAGMTSNNLRKFAEMLLSMGLVTIIVDEYRTIEQIQKFVMVAIICGTAAALIGIGLWILPDNTAENILLRLSVIGYPNGGVIQYIEQNPELAERAIGTSVEPNALGGLLALATTLAIALALSKKTSRNSWHIYASIALMTICLILTFGRGAMLAYGIGLVIIATIRSRKLLWILLAGIGVLLISPWAQVYIERFISGLQGQDIATQMRFGEYKDALILINRYPLIGVGFTGAPNVDIYLGVSNMYLTVASNMGLVGLTTFCILICSVLAYAWQVIRDANLILVGLIAVLFEILVIGIFDHYFFNIEFHHMSTLLWMYVGILLATTRITKTTSLADSPSVN